jgi:uncharacterized cupin superfamily protein
MHTVDLTAVPVGPTEYGHWAALNGPLGLAAFGVNVFEGSPGDQGEIGHDETESDQQELFVVISGRARFVVGDESFEAGPGTALGVSDPAVQRGYEVLEPGTRVLCIGARAPAAQPRWGYWIAGGEP